MENNNKFGSKEWVLMVNEEVEKIKFCFIIGEENKKTLPIKKGFIEEMLGPSSKQKRTKERNKMLAKGIVTYGKNTGQQIIHLKNCEGGMELTKKLSGFKVEKESSKEVDGKIRIYLELKKTSSAVTIKVSTEMLSLLGTTYGDVNVWNNIEVDNSIGISCVNPQFDRKKPPEIKVIC